MLIREVELHEVSLPLATPFVISGGSILERRSLVVVLVDEDGRRGFGEAPAFASPFYSGETLASCRALLESELLPRVEGREFETPEAVDAALTANVRGNAFARAAVETAAWDLDAARHGSGIAARLAAACGVHYQSAVRCGVALGIPVDRSVEALTGSVLAALDAGYTRVKIKIMPGWDLVPVRAVANALQGSGVPLTVDANGAYCWPEHRPLMAELDRVGLLYIEQPFEPADMLGHVAAAEAMETAICIDESLESVMHARQFIALGVPLIWNIKVHRVGGLSEVARLWRLAREAGVRLWAGTMPETGIGSQATLAAAALPGFDLPSDLEPSSRWYGRGKDVVKLTMSKGGTIAVPDVSISRLLDERRFQAASVRLQ